MFAINALFHNPMMAGITASVAAILYFFLMTFNPNLPPALLFSAAIGYFVYTIRSESPTSQTSAPLPIVEPQFGGGSESLFISDLRYIVAKIFYIVAKILQTIQNLKMQLVSK